MAKKPIPPTFSPAQARKCLSAGIMPWYVKGGRYRCSFCGGDMGLATQEPNFHEAGGYVRCRWCKADCLYVAEFPPCEGYPDGFRIDVSMGRKVYPVKLEPAEPESKPPTEATKRRFLAEMAKWRRWEAKLKPCPFCHGKAEFLPQESRTPPPAKGRLAHDCFLIKCRKCNASRFAVTNHMRQLVAEWNHRRDETILAWVSEEDRIGLVRGTKIIVDKPKGHA